MKIIAALIIGLVLTLVLALLGAIPLWLGWNHGFVDALPDAGLQQIDMYEAFCMTLAIVNLGYLLRGASVKVS